MSIESIKRIRQNTPLNASSSQGTSQQQSVSEQLQGTDVFSYAKKHGNNSSIGGVKDENDREKERLASQNVGGMIAGQNYSNIQGQLNSQDGIKSESNKNISSSQGRIDQGANPNAAFSVDRSNNAEHKSSIASQSTGSANNIQRPENDTVTNPNNTNNPGKMEDFQGNNSTAVYSSVFKKQIKSHNMYMIS